MAKCGFCNKSGTKLEEITPTGSRYKYQAICCQSCGSILGVMDYFNIGAGVEKLEQGIKQLHKSAADADHNLRRIVSFLNRR